ncbi:MAG: hypothetical protein LBC29_01385, partial [Propionibacteriaceae bacterium]|nr:hypothetical protein [Propionibacteriaceae bacterium]
MKEYSIQKLVYLTSGVLLFGYFCTFLCVDVIKPNSDILLEKWWWLVPVVLSWMPLVVFFASYVLYDFLMISDEYQRIRSLLYASVISFGLLVVIIAAPVKYFADINFHALNGVVAVISAANLFFHYTAGRRLIETGFSVSRYLATLQRVTDITNMARKKKWSIALDGFISLFALPLVWGFRNSIFVVSCAVIAALILYLLVRYLQACKEI